MFLDTNVINVLVKHSECVFEHAPISPMVDQTLADDIEALRLVFLIGSRANWDIIGSRKVLEELSHTKDGTLRDDLLEFARGIVEQHSASEDRRFAEDFGRRLVDTQFVAALPDAADRELLGNAIGFGCDAFCTRDRATIIRKRDRLQELGIRVITPQEWWAHIRPWARLWW